MIQVKSFQKILSVFTFFLGVVFSGYAYADDSVADSSVGQVIWVKGIVKALQADGKSRDLARRSPVFAHDTITTDASGSGEVTFTDSSVLTLRSDTELKIDDYAYKKDGPPAESKSVMSLVKGGFRTITGKIPKENPDGYAVNTPVATIGVRGTDYSAFYSKEEGLITKIDVGRIVIKNPSGQVELSMELSKVYAQVRLDEMPKVITKPPAVFNQQPPITPVTNVITPVAPNHHPGPPPPGGPHQGGGPPGAPGSEPGKPAGPPKTVSSFCVGLLKGMYQTVSDFFA
jgi:hypothetical protein